MKDYQYRVILGLLAFLLSYHARSRVTMFVCLAWAAGLFIMAALAVVKGK